jgi:tripartite-type tricarboxylate transporter receptor subunit TctC
VAVGAPRPAIRHRQPAGCRRQYRYRGGREVASADGYTLLLATTASAINTTLFEGKLNYNFLRDIVPIAGIFRVPNVMVVHPSVPGKTVPEFIAYAKANPRKLNMASPGAGSPPHLLGELFMMMTGTSVPGYESSAWYGIGAPRDMPAKIVEKLNKEINAGLADPTMKARLADLGGTRRRAPRACGRDRRP